MSYTIECINGGLTSVNELCSREESGTLAVREHERDVSRWGKPAIIPKMGILRWQPPVARATLWPRMMGEKSPARDECQNLGDGKRLSSLRVTNCAKSGQAPHPQ